ncbi:MAG: lipooligosaccharide transport system permease protein [Actinomycetota bacterium]|jgi:lipooligosaccharide transport system permease protein|nr:lipooligosaccharide transport system permease protein [Actinomycetota bacterium]
MSASDVVVRNGLVFWRGWRASFFLSVLSPVMFLSAMGLGLGSMVSEGRSFGGATYLQFFATGILASSAMQSAVFSATYPVLSKIMWQRNYEAMLASPLSVRDILFGEMGWGALTLTQLSVPFFAVMAFMGVFDSWTAVFAIPVVILVGLSCAGPVFAYTSTLQNDESYTWIFRFIVTPLFLLSGTFFPIKELPLWGQIVAQATPLFHGVELVRQLTIYDLGLSALWHLAYLLTLLGIGIKFALRNLEKRLLA